MILRVILIAIVSIFSPLIGLILAVPYFSKKILTENSDFINIESKKSYSTLLILLSVFTACLLFLYVIKLLNWQHGLEVWISVGLGSIIFADILQKLKNYETAIICGALPSFLYIAIKNLFFFNLVKLQFETSNKMLLENTEKLFSPEIVENMMPTILKVQNIMLNGNAAIWMLGIILGLFIGSLILSERLEQLRWNFGLVNFPFYLQIAIVVGLILFILKLRIISYNLLATCGFFYLIQGYSLLYYFVKKAFRKSVFLGIILLIIPLFNFYLLIIISILGLLDTWIHIRKFATASHGE
ncbi:MAG: hypothetical protein U9R23_05385 [Candidatus Cloacimonadota bacterium]|nr:hypothetical protein [Candidatus Cloacimonadota bacterium]